MDRTAASDDLVLYYAPRTRSFAAVWLLEELGAPYSLESFTLQSGRHKKEDYLALNPLGKVPLIVDRGVPVPEMGAQAILFADRYREHNLAPGVEEPERAAYLRWMFFSSAIMEPAMAEKMFGWEARPESVAWGSYARMIDVFLKGQSEGPWLLGDRFTAADVLVGCAAYFGVKFGAFPQEGPIVDYVGRVTEREAFGRAEAIEARESARLFPDDQA